MENCPYCNEFMELASDTPDCTHISIDPRGEYCCLNCNAHFDLDLQEVPIDEGIGKNPSTPTNPTDTPAQNPSQTPTQNPNKTDSSTESKGEQGESSQESNKGDSSEGESKGDSSKEDSTQNPSTPQEPQSPQPPQNLTLSSKEKIALAKQIYASLQGYKNYTKIHTDIIPILQDLQDHLAQDFDLIA